MLKARNILFFTASNPGIENAGFLYESKHKIYQDIPEQWLPATFFVQPAEAKECIAKLLAQQQITYPFIAKPDRGERGWMVEKIDNPDQLEQYLGQIKVPFLVQEYIDMPIEMSIFWYRYPNETHGRVTSVVLKDLLTVTGNGQDTLEALIVANERAFLQYQHLKLRWATLWHQTIPDGQKLLLIPIGNHSRGTAFLNRENLINDRLHQVFNNISNQIDGFYYGRYDIRCSSIEDLYAGKNIKILELNGCGAEPSHIYHPGYSIWKAYHTLFTHYRAMYKICIQNHKKGVPYMTFKEGLEIRKQLRRYNRENNR